MSELTVSRRYAHALYEEAARQDCVEAVDEDVNMLRKSLAETHEFVRLVESPAIPPFLRIRRRTCSAPCSVSGWSR